MSLEKSTWGVSVNESDGVGSFADVGVCRFGVPIRCW